MNGQGQIAALASDTQTKERQIDPTYPQVFEANVEKAPAVEQARLLEWQWIPRWQWPYN